MAGSDLRKRIAIRPRRQFDADWILLASATSGAIPLVRHGSPLCLCASGPRARFSSHQQRAAAHRKLLHP